MKRKKTLLFLTLLLGLTQCLALTIDNITLSRVEPWKGKVQIDYRLEGNVEAGTSACPVLQSTVIQDKTSGTSYQVLSVDRPPSFEEGSHTLIWDAWADGCEMVSSNAAVAITIKKGAPTYCVVNLSAGPNAASYPVTFLDAAPAAGWSSIYKTDNLVLKRVEPGTFAMGKKNKKLKNYYPKVVLTKPYYLGVFEATQRQWELVMGTRPSSFSWTPCYAERPVESISYDDIVGEENKSEKSFLTRLQERTGLDFGLPTEAQWEYACRAGTTTDFYTGEELVSYFNTVWTEQAALTNLGRYWYNGGFSHDIFTSQLIGRVTDVHGTALVGQYKPNAWGFYDMLGNVAEFCSDAYTDFVGKENDQVVDPVVTMEGVKVAKGGGWMGFSASDCCSRGRSKASRKSHSFGFRLACSNLTTETELIVSGKLAKNAVDFSRPQLSDHSYSGNCGNLHWSYSDGRLVVSGTGLMPTNECPWSFLSPWVTEVFIEDGVANIPNAAFSNLKKLVSLTFSDSVKEVGDLAFANSDCISNVTLMIFETSACLKLPSGFKLRKMVRKVVIGNSVVTIAFSDKIGNSLFGCSNFVEYEVDSGNAHFCSVGGYLCDKGKKNLLSVPVGVQYARIPDGIETVEPEAFYGSEAEAVEIPKSVEALSDYALCHADPRMINISGSVKTMGTECMGWMGSTTLRILMIGDTMSHIGYQAFDGHSALDLITIGANTKIIDTRAFAGATPKVLYFYGNVPDGLELSGLIDGAKHVYYPRKYASSYGQYVGENQFAGYSDNVKPKVLLDVIFDAMGGECGRSHMKIAHGENLPGLPSAVRTGYRFDGWYTALDGRGIKVYEGMPIDGCVVLYAHWSFNGTPQVGKIVSHSVMFDDGIGDGTTSWDDFIWHIPHGDEIGELPIVDDSGKEEMTFAGWYTKRVGGAQITSKTKITSDLVLFAHWTCDGEGSVGSSWKNPMLLSISSTAKSETVALCASEYDEDDGVFYCKFQMRCGEKLELKLPYGVYYDIETYADFSDVDGEAFVSEECDENDVTSVILESGQGEDTGELIDCYLTFTGETGDLVTFEHRKGHEEEISIYFDPALGKCAEDEREIAYGAAIGNLPIPSRTGYKFVGWYTDQIGGTKVDSTTKPTYDLYLCARWLPEGASSPVEGATCTVAFDVMEGSVSENQRVVEKGKPVGILPTPTRSKYKFDGWYTAATGGTKVTASTKVTADVTYYAHWTYDGSATVVVNVGSGCEGMGTVSGGKTAKAGTKLTLKATAAKGYVFAGWYLDDAIGTIAATCVSQVASYSYVVGEEDATLYAKFIPTSEDFANVTVDAKEEYVRGVAIEPIAIAVDSGSLATVKVTGLPSGLKFTSKLVTSKVTTGSGKEKVTTLVTNALPNTIYGTPTKSGISTVTVTATTAGKATATETFKMVVRADGEAIVVAEVVLTDAIGTIASTGAVPGKVTGMGVCAKGKTLTLKAVANKGYVFAGWYQDAAETDCGRVCQDPVEGVTDYRSQTLKVAWTGEDITYYARFVSSSEDAAAVSLSINGDLGWLCAGVATSLKIDLDALSIPSVSFKNLPSGLRYNTKTGCIEGVPKGGWTYTAMKSFTATVTTSGKSKRTFIFDYYVYPIPDWAYGTFNGGSDDGQVQLSITSAGKLTGKYLTDGITYTLSAPSFSDYEDDAYLANVTASWSYKENKKTVKKSETWPITVEAGDVGGILTADEFTAGQNVWSQTSWKTFGSSYFGKSGTVKTLTGEEYGLGEGESITMTIKPNGTVTLKGVFDTGAVKNDRPVSYTATGSAVVCVTSSDPFVGQVFVYFAPNANKGFNGYVRMITIGGD